MKKKNKNNHKNKKMIIIYYKKIAKIIKIKIIQIPNQMINYNNKKKVN